MSPRSSWRLGGVVTLLGALVAGTCLVRPASAIPASPGDGCCGGGGGDPAPEGQPAGDGGGHQHGGTAMAEGTDPKAPKDAAGGILVDLGNEKCPIMGGKPNGKTFSEWNGLRIGHCCGMCPAKFQADPPKALDRAGIEWKDAAAAVKKVNDAKTPEDREKALKALQAKWKLVKVPQAPAAKPGLLVDLGNEKCPIMGGKANGETFSEWNGLRIGHCCGMCPAKFQADPPKALDRAKIEWKDAAAAVKKVNDAKTPEEREKALKALRAKWKVIREPAAETGAGSPAK